MGDEPPKRLAIGQVINTCDTPSFSKTITMHDLVIGLFINRYEFGLLI
jgi:hypothetical protein